MSDIVHLQTIRPSRRRDLEVVCRNKGDVTSQGQWIVKDPIQLNYFFLDHIQHWLFERFDGAASLKETQQAFSKAFAGAEISEQQLLNFCMRLSRDGLLNESLSGEKLQQRQSQRNKFKLYKLPLSLMSIRLGGLNANSIIAIAESLFGWIFSMWAVLLAISWILFSALFSLSLLDEIVWALPALADVGFDDVALLLVCISGVKIVHELAHAVCCRKMGARCNEIGLMFLVFSPCLYCNVTDAWMLPSKWKRMAISAAGIYVELIIAATSLVLWHFADTEFLRSLFLNLVIVCSVSTLLVNGNPLMRYDGYFILSDLVNVPNLGQQARSKTWDWFSKAFFFTKQSVGSQNKSTNSAFLICYHIASVIYRIFILSVIFLVFYALLKTVGLQSIAATAGVVYATCLLTSFLLTFIPMIKRKNNQGRRNWAGILTAVLVMGSIAYFVSSIRVPHYISASAHIEFNQLAFCTAKSDGTLDWALNQGDFVEKGAVVAKLVNFDSELERTRLKNKIQLATKKIENLKSRSGLDPDSRIALPSAQSQWRQWTNQLDMLDQRQKELEVIAPTSGVLVESFKPPMAKVDPMKMVAWSGSAIHAMNRGCSIEQGETVCRIGKPNDWKVVLFIDEQKRDLVSGGEEVTLRTSLQRDKTYRAKIAKVFSNATEEALTGQRQFRVELLLDQPLTIGFHGAVGKAKVMIDQQTVWEITKRILTESFRFDF